MKTTPIIASLVAALTMASPVDMEDRQGSVRVQLFDDATDAAVQADIPKTSAKVTVKSKFGNLGNPVQSNRSFLVSGSGTCNLFKDTTGTQKVATFTSSAEVNFGRTNLNAGVIVCS